MDADEWPKYLILDGGLASELTGTHGLPEVDDDPLWSARLLFTNPGILKEVHGSYLESGADVIETASYQASVPGFCEHLSMTEREARELIVLSGTIAIQARDTYWAQHQREGRLKPLVAGSIGPYGACLHDGSEYTGIYVDTMSKQDLVSWHRPRVRALIESGVDLLAFETIPALQEAEAVISLLSEFPNTCAWISFMCKDGQHLAHGEHIKEAVQSVASSNQVVGVGVNCTAPEHITSLATSIKEVCGERKRIIVYPNSGETWTDEKRWSGKESCTPIHERLSDWLDAGVTWIGGCCRIGPSDINKIRLAMDVYTSIQNKDR